MSEIANLLSAATPPTPGEVINAIHDIAGDGSDSYEIENGSVATFWFGYAFELDGAGYYTGFVAETPEKYNDAEKDADPTPDTQVTLSQATFSLAQPGAARAWGFEMAEFSIGKFGAFERGNAVDDKRKPQTYKTPDGKFVLAVPTWSLSGGVRVDAYDLFAFDPADLTDPNTTHWTYLGSVAAGEDNGASCDEDDDQQPCARSFGALSFEPHGDDLPLIHVAMSGTRIVAAGKVRTLGPADALEYRYVATENQYQPSAQ